MWSQQQQNQLPPLHAEAIAEPELGDFRSSQNVVTTIELANLHAMKLDDNNGESGANVRKSEPTIAVIPMEDILPMNQQDKIGGICCGFCCDYRRAVIWSNIALLGILCFLLVVQAGLDDAVEMLYDDDEVSHNVNEVYATYLSKIKILEYITILTSFASAISASLFSIWMPAFQIVWLISVMIASIFIFLDMYAELEEVYATTPDLELTNPAPILVGLAIGVTTLLYPHVAYTWEIYQGILTRETYPREERCCCC